MRQVNYKHLGEVNLVLDGNGLMFRSFDFTGKNMLYTSDGKPTVSVFRTLKTILYLYSIFNIRNIIVALDGIKINKTTIRHLLYSDYKSNRPDKPSEIIPQFDYLKEILDAVDIHYIEAPELYEGDDVIATVAYNWATNKQRNIIVSSDHDMMQLVSNYTAFYCLNKKQDEGNILYTLKKSDPEINMKSIEEEYGISPLQFADVKALTGDNSDNIPGVNGIGPKTAIPLIQKFKSVELLYDYIYKLKNENIPIKGTDFTEKMIEKLLLDEQVAYLSKELAMIHRTIKINLRNTQGNFKTDKAYNVLKKYEFNDIIKYL